MPINSKEARESTEISSPLLDVKETARYLGLSRNTIYAESQAGRLPTVRFGRRVFVVKQLLDEMIISSGRSSSKK